ncbi:MAG: dihydroorotate oxidase [Patescibacteria group bacterium]|nr:dihydroorotate oxidase [Patescibacteria group bacterium]
MLLQPFYDPLKTYEENYEQGPFGAFADHQIFKDEGEPQYEFLGRKVFAPFGIPAGPLINSNFVKAAFEKGFDICVYKTVRTRAKKVNEWPNILPVKVRGDLTLEQAQKGLVVKKGFTEPLAITNSFGNPSFSVDVWQQDIADVIKWANGHPGKFVSGMIEGTRWGANFTENDFLKDWVLAARLMNGTKVHGIEANFSCPNEGNLVKRLLCYDIAQSQRIADAIKNEIGNTPLVIKVSYFQSDDELRSLVKELGRIVDGISAINTIPSAVLDENGKQALPGGPWRLKSGICGAPVKWAGLDMVERLKFLREELGMKFAIIGVGGVMSVDDYHQYVESGADAVMSATGAMWNPFLAQEIKKAIK